MGTRLPAEQARRRDRTERCRRRAHPGGRRRRRPHLHRERTDRSRSRGQHRTRIHAAALDPSKLRGLDSQDIATPHNATSFLHSGFLSEYAFFSSDLSQALVEPEGETPLPPLEAGAEKTPYLRDNGTCGEPDRCFVPLVTKSNVPSGAIIGEDRGVEFDGATPDLSHVVLQSPEALTANAVKDAQERPNLYEWAGGELQLVSILPNHVSASAENEEASLGYRGKLVRNAISDEGSRIVGSRRT